MPISLPHWLAGWLPSKHQRCPHLPNLARQVSRPVRLGRSTTYSRWLFEDTGTPKDKAYSSLIPKIGVVLFCHFGEISILVIAVNSYPYNSTSDAAQPRLLLASKLRPHRIRHSSTCTVCRQEPQSHDAYLATSDTSKKIVSLFTVSRCRKTGRSHAQKYS